MRFHSCTPGTLQFSQEVVICAPLGNPISLDLMWQSSLGGLNEYCPLCEPVNSSVSNSSHVGNTEDMALNQTLVHWGATYCFLSEWLEANYRTVVLIFCMPV